MANTLGPPDSDGMVVLVPGTTNPGYKGQRVCLKSSAAALPAGSREQAIVNLNCDRRDSEIDNPIQGYETFHNTAYDVKRAIATNPNSDWVIDSSKQIANNV